MELFSSEAAGALVEWMPVATPPPTTLVPHPVQSADGRYLIWIDVIGVVTVVALAALILAVRVF